MYAHNIALISSLHYTDLTDTMAKKRKSGAERRKQAKINREKAAAKEAEALKAAMAEHVKLASQMPSQVMFETFLT